MTDPRPRVAQRTHPLAVRVTAAEHDTLTRRAAACGITLSAYLRQAALGTVPRRRPRALERRALSELGRVGNNLNQLARIANTTGRLGAERHLREVLRQVHRAVDALREP